MAACEPTIPPRWTAWQRRPGERWQKVCEAPTEEECRLLFWQIPFKGKSRDVFFTQGANPNRPRRCL
jgi:hypothetical protein